MTDSDVPTDREEYLSRLGVVLALARRSAGYSQEQAAIAMGMSTAAFTRWESGANGISAYDLTRLIRLYGMDPDLAVNPPASRVEIKRRLGPVASAAQRAVRRAQLRALPDEAEGGPE
jgi:transcriptional regulator with XRE-family HTH domain